jgi:7,8-dihydropterin-6-yl-methyl-4-(beta-D-ribofuranosyl)aminobenzene 5'-phosphate synthase
MVVVVGCSHTGIDNIVKAAAAINPKILFVAGGLHLVVAKDPDIDSIATTLHDTYKVEYIAPGHCTGEPTFGVLRRVFGDRYLYAGVGTTFDVSGTPRAIANGRDPAAMRAQADADFDGYRALLARSDERRRRALFSRVGRADAPDGAYLALWRASLTGCC